MKYFIILLLVLYTDFMYSQSDIVNNYSVEWNSPSENASGSMPIGNGELGANVWMENNGNIVFYLSRTDSWSENSSLYKLGKVRVSFNPLIIDKDTKFKQFLDLKNGKIDFEISNANEKIDLTFLVDSENPVAYLKGKSTYPLQITVSSEIWRTQVRLIPEKERHFALEGCPFDDLCMEYPDTITGNNKELIVYHRNKYSIYPFTLKHQGLQVSTSDYRDPLMNRTFGYCISGPDFTRITPYLLSSEVDTKDFTLKFVTHVGQFDTSEEWIENIKEVSDKDNSFKDVQDRTSKWWNSFWDKSYILVQTPDETTGYKITQSYILQRWVSACGGRGNYPIKFNGSIFTVDPFYTSQDKNYNPDFRLWGPDYWWQNTRLMYHSMLKSGDYDMMKVLFEHYISILPILKENARVLWNAKGAVNPETATIFGATVNHDYGWVDFSNKTETIDNPYVRYYWSSGLEIVGLMLDYYIYTKDMRFISEILVPFSKEILEFYNSFFKRDENEKLIISPTHSLETYWDNVVNDLPNIAGLHYILPSLLSLPDEYIAAYKNQWERLYRNLPDIPTRNYEGSIVFSPAESYTNKQSNVENPELYAIFPFTLCNISSNNLKVGIDTYKMRMFKSTNGWTQDGQQAARLGLTDEAKDNLISKIQNSNPNYRFPAIWGPNYDWTPDQCHGANLMITLQDMIVQSYGSKVYLLPAFPKDWNVSFRLYVPDKNIITGVYNNKKWERKPKFINATKMKILK